MTYTQILGLTAKERDKEGDHATLNRNAPIVDRVTIKECLVNGWIAPFTIYNLGIELNTKDRAYYNSIHKKFIKYFSTFDFSLSKMFNCLSDKQAREVLAREMNWEEKMVMVHASQANRIMQQRKKWLYTYPALYDKTEELIKLFPEKRIITFSQVTSSVDLLEDRIPNSVAYHSAVRTKVYKDYDKDTDEGTLVAVANKVYNSTTKKNVTMYTFEGTNYHWKDLKKIIDGKLTRISGDKQKQLALKEFLSGKANVIHSASALNEGVDIPGLDMSIKTSFNSTIIDSIQRTGRTARIDNNNSDKRAIEVNLYIKDTQSERWLKNSQKETPNVQWIDSVKDVIL
jgi:superfamily II DNA or RNA helicase